jgi:outer membrane protein OmpA-like peptidoglycan-associated protein
MSIKHTIMKHLIIVSAFIVPLIGFSQTSVKKASNYYNNYSYPKVIEKLEGKDNLSTEAYRELAESYKMANDFAKAEASYAKVVAAPDKIAEDVYHYAQLLKMNGKYADAQKQMDAYAALNNDKRAILYEQNKSYLTDLLKDKGQFTIKNLEVNSLQQDFGAVYYKDQIVYTSSKTPISGAYRRWNGNNLAFLDLYAGKANSESEITDAKKISKLNKKYHEGPASYSKDGNTVMYTLDNYKTKSSDGVRKLQMYEARFKDGAWGDKVPFPYNNKEYSMGHPALTADGNTLYFASDMPGGKGGVDLYKTSRGADGKWTTPENLGDKINTEGNEVFPFIHESGLFFFSSDGIPGLGGLDIFATEIKNGQAGKIINVGVPVNGSKDDFSMVLNAEKTKGYFASNRAGGKGDDDIYAFNMLRPFIKKTMVEGVVTDKKNGNPLSEAKVELKDPSGKTIASAVTDNKGDYSFETEPEKDYSIFVSRDKYFGNNASFSFKNLPIDTYVLKQDIAMDENVGLALYALLTDSKTTLPLDSVHLIIIDKATNEVLVKTYTPKSGDAFKGIPNKKVGDKISYEVVMTKRGYFPKEVIFNYEIKTAGTVKIHEVMNGALEMDKEVADLKDMVEIRPIKFDYNKFNIRPDAAIELDKIITIMNKYPKMVIELGAHTDCRGAKAYNEKLSDKRAKSSAAYIQSKIVNPDRIYGKGYGENKILNGCSCEGAVKSDCTEEQHQENRRTEFKVISAGGNETIINKSTDSFDKNK